MKKIILLLGLVLISNKLFLGNVFSLEVSFSNIDSSFDIKISPISFYNGSDTNPQQTAGFFILKGIDTLSSPEKINLNEAGVSKSILCYGKLRGYYVNLVRGNYLLPLSEEDKASFLTILNGDSKIDVKGGFYTNCIDKGEGIFGEISYTYNGNDFYSLYAGFAYDIVKNDILFGSGFIGSFILNNGLVPLGFVYDELGGVGMVNLIPDGILPSSIQENILSQQTELTGLDDILTDLGSNEININGLTFKVPNVSSLIQSVISIVGAYNLSEANFFLPENKQTILNQLGVIKKIKNGLETVEVQGYNVSKNYFQRLINGLRKRAYEICRNNWKEITGTKSFDGLANKLGKLNCFKVKTSTGAIIINYDVSSSGISPIVIVKGTADVIINDSMEGKDHMKLFLDKGRLLVGNEAVLSKIGQNGKVVSENELTSGFMLKGEYIVNGLIGGYSETVGYTGFAHKLYIRGKLATLNSVSIPKESRVNYINDLLDVYGENFTEEDINLQKIFKRRCQENGVGTDGVSCSSPEDKWSFNSLILIGEKVKDSIIR